MSVLAVAAELLDRITTIADEAFGPFPVQTPSESLTAIERGIFDQRQRIAELERAIAPAAPEPDPPPGINRAAAFVWARWMLGHDPEVPTRPARSRDVPRATRAPSRPPPHRQRDRAGNGARTMIALPFDLSDIVDAAVKDATGEKHESLHTEIQIGASRVRLICVPTPRPRSSVLEELGEHLGRAAADPFHVGAVAVYGAVFVVIPSKIALRFGERDPTRSPS